MQELSAMLQTLEAGRWDTALRRLACAGAEAAPALRARASQVVQRYARIFGWDTAGPAGLFSAPGRTEIGGNHTDHQHGRVLAAAVNLDVLACAAPNGTNVIRFQSEGWPMVEVDLDRLEPVEAERETTAALIRGMAAQAAGRGYTVGGFDAYAVSDVLPGSGLSSSAACEVLIGVILNRLFCGGALEPVTIAQMGQRAENDFFGKPSGLMDQTASAVGSAVAIDFADPAAPVVRPVKVDLDALGYALCIIDSGASHADLTAEYAAIPREMGAVAAYFGKKHLREVEPIQVTSHLEVLRAAAGDRAVLRALHFFDDDRRAAQEADALEAGDMDRFLALVRASGVSSWTLLQNMDPTGAIAEQPMAVALAMVERALDGRGAARIHGGGFAGTLQAFVPLDALEDFRAKVENALGRGSCHVLAIRPAGGVEVTPEA